MGGGTIRQINLSLPLVEGTIEHGMAHRAPNESDVAPSANITRGQALTLSTPLGGFFVSPTNLLHPLSHSCTSVKVTDHWGGGTIFGIRSFVRSFGSFVRVVRSLVCSFVRSVGWSSQPASQPLVVRSGRSVDLSVGLTTV